MLAGDGAAERRWEAPALLRAAGRTALDLLFPPADWSGGAAQAGGFASAAWTRISFIEAPVCDGCGAPQAYQPLDGRCPGCFGVRRAVSRVRAACLYDEHSRDPILQLKHADRTDLAPLFATWLSRAAAELLAEADAVAPVPLHPGRLFRRRYNQAAEVARPLAARQGLAYLPDAVVRGRSGTQGGQSRAGRRRTVQGAFSVPAARRSRVAGRRILLVDDVLTTGATVEACAKALLAAGAESVDVAVIARVRESAPA